jgi:hypothetical protein
MGNAGGSSQRPLDLQQQRRAAALVSESKSCPSLGLLPVSQERFLSTDAASCSHVLRTTHYALCTVQCALCTMHYALCTMHCALRTAHYALNLGFVVHTH